MKKKEKELNKQNPPAMEVVNKTHGDFPKYMCMQCILEGNLGVCDRSDCLNYYNISDHINNKDCEL